MTRVWLLFGILALASGQLAYPGQYKGMTTNYGRASASLPSDYQVTRSSQSVQQIQSDQQFNGGPTAQFGAANPAASPTAPRWGAVADGRHDASPTFNPPADAGRRGCRGSCRCPVPRS